MTTITTADRRSSIAPETQVGVITLTVSDLQRSIAFYTKTLGFAMLQQTGPDVILGIAGTPLLLLHELSGARPWPTDAVTGLYHFAILLPTRADLGRWLRHYLTLGYPLPGQGDHLVSEALYLRDPDDHGIEVYRDRPRAEWRWKNGQVQMAADPVDIRGLLEEAAQPGEPWAGLPAGTTIGHIHLQVGDIARAEAFYHGVLGFDVVAQLPMALFVSAGGYHHHLGMNTWHSRGAAPAPKDTANLRFFTLALPTEEALAAVVARLAAAGISSQAVDDLIVVRDPWQNTILLHVRPLSAAQAAAALATAPASLSA